MNRSLRTGITVVSLVAAPALGGCATTYHPRPSPRIVLVPEGGSLALEKNGHVYSMGIFSSGLEEAVQGNAQAEDEAASFRSNSTAGFVLGILGGITVGAGAGVLGYSFESQNGNGNPSTGLLAASISLMIGGIVLGIVSNSLYSSAHSHAYNAINIYNDGLGGGGYVPQPGWAPQGYAPAAPGYAPAPPGYAPPPPAYPPSYAPQAPPALPAPAPLPH